MDIRQVDNSQASSRLPEPRLRHDALHCGAPPPGQIRAYRFRGPRTILTPAITRPGVQNPAVDALIAQIRALAGQQTEASAAGPRARPGADMELLHAADVVYGAGQDGLLE